jgi:hypothetical protein
LKEEKETFAFLFISLQEWKGLCFNWLLHISSETLQQLKGFFRAKLLSCKSNDVFMTNALPSPEHTLALSASDSSDTIFYSSNCKALSITPPHGLREVGRGIVYCGEVGVLVENRPYSKN